MVDKTKQGKHTKQESGVRSPVYYDISIISSGEGDRGRGMAAGERVMAAGERVMGDTGPGDTGPGLEE